MLEQFDFEPRARASDPVTSHLAAVTTRPGNHDLLREIRRYAFDHGASTSYEIADALEGRWAHDTVRSACARAGLIKVPGGETPRGNPCMLYALAVVDVMPL